MLVAPAFALSQQCHLWGSMSHGRRPLACWYWASTPHGTAHTTFALVLGQHTTWAVYPCYWHFETTMAHRGPQYTWQIHSHGKYIFIESFAWLKRLYKRSFTLDSRDNDGKAGGDNQTRQYKVRLDDRLSEWKSTFFPTNPRYSC